MYNPPEITAIFSAPTDWDNSYFQQYVETRGEVPLQLSFVYRNSPTDYNWIILTNFCSDGAPQSYRQLSEHSDQWKHLNPLSSVDLEVYGSRYLHSNIGWI